MLSPSSFALPVPPVLRCPPRSALLCVLCPLHHIPCAMWHVRWHLLKWQQTALQGGAGRAAAAPAACMQHHPSLKGQSPATCSHYHIHCWPCITLRALANLHSFVCKPHRWCHRQVPKRMKGLKNPSEGYAKLSSAGRKPPRGGAKQPPVARCQTTAWLAQAAASLLHGKVPAWEG